MRSKSSPQESTYGVNWIVSARTMEGFFSYWAPHIFKAFPFIGKAIGIKGAFLIRPEKASFWVLTNRGNKSPMFSFTKRSLQMGRGLKEKKNHVFSSRKMNLPLSLWCFSNF